MAPSQNMLLGLLTVTLIFILFLNLEIPLKWSIQPLKQLQVFALGERRYAEDSYQITDEQVMEPSVLLSPNPRRDSGDAERPSAQDINSSNQTERTPATYTSTPKSENTSNTEHSPSEKNNHLSTPLPSPSIFYLSDKNRTKISTKAPAVMPKQPTQAALIKDPLYIGDTYMSEDIPLQTHCPDGIQSKVTDTEIRAQFLKSIPVLLLARHITPEQYQRLKLYIPVHGWRGVDYKTLVDTFSHFNSSAHWQIFDDWKDRSNTSECITCAVVGNGGILNGSKKGEEIDSHHYVFRTNGAIIKGFERDVGSRTTHFTFTTMTLKNSFRRYTGLGFKGPPQSKETRYVLLPSHEYDYLMVKAAVEHTLVERGRDKGKDPTKLFGENLSAKKFKMIHPDFMRYIRNRFLRSKKLKASSVGKFRSSTGAAMLLAALHTCDKVSAYGFITPEYAKYSRYYYDRVVRPVGFTSDHDLEMEMVLWQQLHQAGLLQLYMRS